MGEYVLGLICGAFFTFVIMSDATFTIDDGELNKAAHICENNGGAKSLTVGFDRFFLDCKDGANFNLTYKND